MQPEPKWSSDPGAYEAHLIRKQNNPYFPPSDRVISETELAEAKGTDLEDQLLMEEEFHAIGQIIKENDEFFSGESIKLVQRLTELIRFSLGVGGSAYAIKQPAEQFRDAVIKDIRIGFLNDPRPEMNKEGLADFEEAVRFEQQFTERFHSIPVLAQHFRKRSPIKPSHLVAAIISEDPETLARFLEWTRNELAEDGQIHFITAAFEAMEEARREGHVDPYYREKIVLLATTTTPSRSID